jgi:hypothetical protein
MPASPFAGLTVPAAVPMAGMRRWLTGWAPSQSIRVDLGPRQLGPRPAARPGRRDLGHLDRAGLPGHSLALGADVDNAALREMAAGSDLADLIWEAPDQLTAEHAQAFKDATQAHLAGDAERAGQLWENLQAIWSHAWSSNYAVLEFMQSTGLTRFSPVKPQHWVIASFEHHTSPHGLPRPHIHNIALPSLTTSRRDEPGAARIAAGSSSSV